MRYIIAISIAFSSAACTTPGAPGETVLPSPSVVIETANTVCNTQITSLGFDVDYSGPYLIIDIRFASAPSPVELEIERYLADGSTEPVSQLTNVVGRSSIALHFNTKYRGRARAGSCPWTPWVDQQIGPPNPCGSCTAAPPPPPPLPPPPPPPDDEEECESNVERLTNWLGQAIKRMEEPPPPPPACTPS